MNFLPTGLPPPGSNSDAPSMGPDHELMITNLMGLGNWTHQQVVRALRASYNNPHRAVDYLFNGVPGGTTTTTSTTTTTTGEEQGTTTSNERNTGDQWAPLRQLMQTNPQMVPLLLQHMAQSNPRLVQTLASNPQAMQEVLQSLGQSGSGERGSGGGLGSTGTDGGTQPPRISDVQRSSTPLTADEKKSVDNLEALGFGRSKALEAFLLFERNEELAANYLFDHAGDGDSGLTFGFGGPSTQQDDEEDED